MRAAFLKETRQGLEMAVKLQPRASRQEVAGVQGSELRIRVTAPPVDAAANRALVEYVAELCGLRRADVELIRGQTSRHKTLLIRGVTAEVLLERLQVHRG